MYYGRFFRYSYYGRESTLFPQGFPIQQLITLTSNLLDLTKIHTIYAQHTSTKIA